MSELAITKAALAIGHLKSLTRSEGIVDVYLTGTTVDIIAEGWDALVRAAAEENP